ncbi:hypothetical protein [Xenorhabdus cabanillasii]|uniref:Uncharacterized protein n=2 Tax=Xenorhabdus cabanillasii TaxID=351673 RepID=A0A3D9UFZ2_9GAMM|nr:hypothetical protein [Xenorhabdus cabanillasii]PHM75873.1 hypothetical protein Xcab_03624 [Xenorhabdus cabanillasii JM26]REF26870.1 hypothetical protein BDD26_1565 [Xenorhabdus cabanillasii]CDL80010.1 hypothetical protein XCR1_1320011 [Xenorhabdus cabanillasii JM26]
MSSNDKSVSNKIREDDDTTIHNVKIVGVEADVLFSNIEIKFVDSQGFHFDKFYLSYPEHRISGEGIYITLLLALNNSFLVSLKLTKATYPAEFRYISGVKVEIPGVIPDPHAPWN